jgi:predicted nucleic acid-binding protein
MVVSDTNIISTFARIDQLDLLRQLFKVPQLHLTPGTYAELQKAVEVGCTFLEPVVEAIEQGQGFELLTLTKDEALELTHLPTSLGAGEKESISVSRHRPKTTLLTNDKRARNYCRAESIPCLDLPELLRALWQRGVCSKQEVRELIQRIETEKGMVLKDKQNILK